MFTLVSLACIIIGLILINKYLIEKKKKEEERGFLVIGTLLLCLWLYPGLFLLSAGLILLITIIGEILF